MTSTAERALSDPFARITRQNHCLLQAIQKDNFDGFIRLDPTLNQAVTLIHAANEDIVRYPQGSFPLHVAYPMVYSTLHLLKACEKRYGRVKVKAMNQAFCNLFRLWFYAGAPRCPGEIFAKKLFEGEDQLFSAICEHNRSIGENAASPIVAKAPKRGGVTKGTPSCGRVPSLSPRKEHVLNESKITCWLHDRAFDLLGLTEAQRRAAMKRDFTGRKIAAATRVREATVGKIVSLRARSLGGGTLNESAAQLYYLICNDPDLFDLFAEIERRHKPPRRNKDVNEHARRLKTEIEAELRRR